MLFLAFTFMSIAIVGLCAIALHDIIAGVFDNDE